MKKAKILIAATILSASMSMVAFAGQWKQDAIGWWYQNDDGTYLTSAWYQENDKWYYFNKDGYMVTGWLHFTDTDTYYYFEQDGSMRTEPLEENGVTYTFDENGAWNNGYNSQIQDIYDREALGLKLKYGYDYNQSYNQGANSGVSLSNEHIVSYHDVAQDK